MKLRHYQESAITAIRAAWADGHQDVLAVMATGAGKAQPGHAGILTPTGWIQMQDVRIGSDVIGSDGMAHRVTGIYPRGVRSIYRVTFSDDTQVDCCDEHLWQVQTKSQKSRGGGWAVKPLADLMGDLVDGSGASKWFIPVVVPVHFFEPIPPVIDPYVLGVLIGDGSIIKSSPRISSADQFILDEVVARLGGTYSLAYVGGYDYIILSGVVGSAGAPLTRALKGLGLYGRRSHDKFIPLAYKYGSVQTRLDLLRGLMDTDGTTPVDGRAPEFTTVSRELADDVAELVRSLGGVTIVRTKKPGIYTHNGERRTGRISYRVTVSIPFNPFLLPRKAQSYNAAPKQGRTKAMVNIEYVGDMPCQCISVDTADHLYVTDGYTLTHNTQTFLSLLMGELDTAPSARALIIAHRKELIEQPLERIGQMNPAWLAAHDRPRVGLVMGQHNDCDRQLTIATVQTLASENRLAALLEAGPITRLVIDECHHATAASYVKLYERLRLANPAMLSLGVTATPQRADGDGLSKIYQHVAAKVTIADLVKERFLVQPRWLAISTGISLVGVHTRQGDYVQGELADRFDTPGGREIVVRSYLKYAAGRRAIAFTASVEGARELAAAFVAAGVSARSVDGGTPKDERAAIMADFRAGRFQILTNCQVATEGFDAPGTSCVLMCRPTRSDALYIQCMGRGLRPAAGMAHQGEDCLILDFLPADARNIVMAGDVLGLPKEVARDALKPKADGEEEPGEVQAGFTFDGENFNTGGTPLEIISRELNYLAAIPVVGFRRDEMLTIGLGEVDGVERILAIRDGVLYGIAKRRDDRVWQCRALECEDAYEAAAELSAKWSQNTVAAKGRAWHSQPISEPQAKFLKRPAGKDLTTAYILGLKRRDAADLITHYLAKQALQGM